MRPTVLALLLALPVAACADGAASDAGVTMVATPWPLEWLAGRVAPDADVHGVGEPGQDPHELDLRPGERELLDRADVILHVGPVGFQPQVEEAAAARGDAALALTAVAEDQVRSVDGDTDPHVWFDPRVLAEAAPRLADRLAAADPAGAAGYRERADAVRTELRALHSELDTILSGCRHDLALVGHEAFAYLLAPRDLTQLGVSGVGGHSDASPARLAELSRLVSERDIPAVLTEPVEGRDAAEALARETGVRLLEVDTLESPARERRELGYPELLRAQARVFAQALECAP